MLVAEQPNSYSQHPLYQSISTLVNSGKDLEYSDDNGPKFDKYIVLDNNTLSDLAAAAKNANHEFKQLIKATDNPVFIIPEIIFQESVRNIKNIQQFKAIYLTFYQTVAKLAPIFILSMEEQYEMYTKNFINKDAAFDNFLDITSTLNDNQDIRILLQNAKTIQDIETAIRSVQSDCGERIAFIYLHIMLAEKLPNIRFFSNEVKGVYNKWLKVYSTDGDLLKKIYVKNPEEYIMALRVQSFQKLIFDFTRHKISDPTHKQLFINNIRLGKNVNDIVYYCHKGLEVFHTKGVSNVEFNVLVLNQEIILFY